MKVTVNQLGGYLKINATDYLLMSGNKILLRTTNVESPAVSIPFPDYQLPVERPYETISVERLGGSLLINATEPLWINAAQDELLIRDGGAASSPRVDIPTADYNLPVEEPYERVAVYPTGSLLKFNATDYLLMSGNRLLIRPGTIYSPVIDVPAPDYQIAVPE